jgi:hypothetical protein
LVFGDRFQRGKVAPAELEERHRLVEVLQPVLAELAEAVARYEEGG